MPFAEGENQEHKAKYVAPLNLEKLPKEELEWMYALVKEKLCNTVLWK